MGSEPDDLPSILTDSDDGTPSYILNSAQDWSGLDFTVSDGASFCESYGRTCNFRAAQILSLSIVSALSPNAQDRALKELSDSGISLICLSVHWSEIEPESPGQLDDLLIDKIVAFLETLCDRGMRCVLACRMSGVCGPPKWLSSALDNVHCTAASDFDLLSSLCHSSAHRPAPIGGLTVRDWLSSRFVKSFSYLARRVYALPSLLAFQFLGCEGDPTRPISLLPVCRFFQRKGDDAPYGPKFRELQSTAESIFLRFKAEITALDCLLPVLRPRLLACSDRSAPTFYAGSTTGSERRSFALIPLVENFIPRLASVRSRRCLAGPSIVYLDQNASSALLEHECEECERRCTSFCPLVLPPPCGNSEGDLPIDRRKLESVTRPYASRIPGKPLYSRFQWRTLDYRLAFVSYDCEPESPDPFDRSPVLTMQPLDQFYSTIADPARKSFRIVAKPKRRLCEIFLPNLHYADFVLGGNPKDSRVDFLVTVSDGEWEYNRETQTLHWWFSEQSDASAGGELQSIYCSSLTLFPWLEARFLGPILALVASLYYISTPLPKSSVANTIFSWIFISAAILCHPLFVLCEYAWFDMGFLFARWGLAYGESHGHLSVKPGQATDALHLNYTDK